MGARRHWQRAVRTRPSRSTSTQPLPPHSEQGGRFTKFLVCRECELGYARFVEGMGAFQ